MAVVFALCCLACSALNDFLFKLFANGAKMSRGIFFAIIGLLWTGVTAALTPWNSIDVGATVLWGIISGIFSITSNILLIEAMGKLNAGICSTVFRLNLIFVVPGAMLCFGEKLSWLQFAGILLAIAAILLFFFGEHRTKENALSGAGGSMLFAASFLRAMMGLSYKAGFLHGADNNGLIAVNGCFWIAGGILYALCRDKKLRFPTGTEWKFGMISGSFVIGIVYFMAKSLQFGAAGIVLSIAQMSFLVTFLLSAVFLKEKAVPAKITAMLCGIGALLLLGR